MSLEFYQLATRLTDKIRPVVEDGAGLAAGLSAGPVNGPAGGGATTENDIAALPVELGRKKKKKKTPVVGMKESVSYEELNSILRVYRDVEKGSEPSADDLDSALMVFYSYINELNELARADDRYFTYFAASREEGEKTKQRYKKAEMDARDGLSSSASTNQKLAALDRVVDLVHNDMYALEHIIGGSAGRDKLYDLAHEIVGILRRMGKFTKWGRRVPSLPRVGKLREPGVINKHVDEAVDHKVMEAILRVYRDIDRGLDPRTEDIDEALLAFYTYTNGIMTDSKKDDKYTDYWARSAADWQKVKRRYFDAENEAKRALGADVSDKEKIAALDRMIDLMHNHYYALEHLTWGGSDELKQMAFEVILILRKMGKFPKGIGGLDRDKWQVIEIVIYDNRAKRFRYLFDDEKSAYAFEKDMKKKYPDRRYLVGTIPVGPNKTEAGEMSDIGESILEAVEEDLGRLRKELKQRMIKLMNQEEFQFTASTVHDFQSVFGVGRPRTQRVAISVERQQKDAQKLYGDILREHGDDKGSIEMIIAAMQDGRPLGQFAGMNKYDYLYGTRVEVTFGGVNLVLEAKVDFIYDVTASIYVDNEEIVDEVEKTYGHEIKRKKNLLYPVGGKFKPDFFGRLKDLIGDSVEGVSNE